MTEFLDSDIVGFLWCVVIMLLLFVPEACSGDR